MVYNSLEFERHEYLCFHIDINAKNWILKDADDNVVSVQVNYLWNEEKLITDKLEACFLSRLKPLSVSRYSVEQQLSTDAEIVSDAISISRVELINFDDEDTNNLNDNYEKLIKKVDIKPSEIVIKNNLLKLVFSPTDGMLKRVIQLRERPSPSDNDHATESVEVDGNNQGMKDEELISHEVKLSFRTFSTIPSKKDHRSGAYLFIPGERLFFVIFLILSL